MSARATLTPLGAVLLSVLATGALAEPIALSNASPLARLAGPPVAQPARLTRRGDTALSLLVAVASHSASSMRGDEQLLLDGETWETTVIVRRGLANGLELGLELPLIVHENGVFDPAIDAYHDLTGLPGGERDAMATNQLGYLYRTADGRRFRLDNPASGLGDLSVYAALPLLAGDHPQAPALSLRGGVRLPTGDDDRWLGNGAFGLSLALAGTRSFRLLGYDGDLYARVGLLAPAVAGGAVLDDVQETLAGYATVAMRWHRWRRLSLSLQFDSNTALWDSAISDVGKAPLQVLVGGEWRPGRAPSGKSVVAFGFAEDLAIDRSPDIAFFVNWRRRY
ncbi:MAG: DUF3187 family protein [Pseudomonadota bacterium]